MATPWVKNVEIQNYALQKATYYFVILCKKNLYATIVAWRFSEFIYNPRRCHWAGL